MTVGLLVLILRLPGCGSLKEKRGRLKPLMHKLYKQFKLSVSEVDDQDIWGQAVIACAVVTSDAVQSRRILQKTVTWIEQNWFDVELVDSQIDIL